MLILVLESSTTSAKAMLFDTEEGMIDLITEEYHFEYNDTATQDAEGVFLQTVQVGRRVCAGRKIDGIVLSGIWHSVMLCDKEMKPRTRVLSWANTEAADVCKRLRENKDAATRYYKKTGCIMNAIYPSFKLLYFKEKGYKLEDYYILGQGSYNTFRLTGKRIVTDCMASGSGLMDIHTKKYDDTILNWIGIKEEQLCEIVSYKAAAPLSKEGAELLGAASGIPVMPPCADGALNQVGVGALETGIMTFSVGTSAAIRMTASKPHIPDVPSTWCYLSPDSWLIGTATSGACNCTDWFRGQFYPSAYDNEDEEDGNRIQIDSPVFLPFLYGERSPGWSEGRRGAFVGIQPQHTNADFYHAIQEGILFNIYQCYQILCQQYKTPNRIILSGGILKSDDWTQMCADIFGIPMEIPSVSQSSLMGAAILAAEGFEAILNSRAMPYEKYRIIQPNAELRQLYNTRFKTYQYWYDKLI